MTVFDISSPDQIKDALDWAISEKQSLSISGNGSKESLGRPMEVAAELRLANLSGVRMYEPAELVMKAAAGSSFNEINAVLHENDQQLAFCPPDLGPLLGQGAGLGTLGGVFCSNLSGSQRIKMGAARDHLLGVNGFTGRAQAFQTGSRVMKNVTGYDLCKLVAGSYGTLAVCSEFTFKVLPKPEKLRTVLIFGQEPNAAVITMRDAMSSVHEVAAAAYLPEQIAGRTNIDYVSNANRAVTAILIDGNGPSVDFRLNALRSMFDAQGELEELHSKRSSELWKFVSDVGAYVEDQRRLVWRVSLPPSDAADYIFRLRQQIEDLEYFMDWAGGLLWLSLPEGLEDAGQGIVRSQIRNGGHATLIRASSDIRSRVEVFQPVDVVKARISEKIREGFDPYRILNPARMYSIG
ncbi:FAD-binding protein [Sneathiella glossodoripedis]|uniref:FAD-binding protein n=1 Tax=Sneathiella glossodoripedis TaxID=418853 RepID=UPI00046FAF64|nr:FAD-binding protein [Sneathiella glossodoripedis]